MYKTHSLLYIFGYVSRSLVEIFLSCLFLEVHGIKVMRGFNLLSDFHLPEVYLVPIPTPSNLTSFSHDHLPIGSDLFLEAPLAKDEILCCPDHHPKPPMLTVPMCFPPDLPSLSMSDA